MGERDGSFTRPIGAPLREVIRGLAPENAFHTSGGFMSLGAWASTWTTPEGQWTVAWSIALGTGGTVQVTPPGGDWRITGDPTEVTRKVVGLLRGLAAIPAEKAGDEPE